MSAIMLVENSMIVCNSDSYEHGDDGHQETCEVSYISSPTHGVSNNSSSSSCSSSSGDEDEQGRSTCRKITKQHKQSPSKKKKRSLIGEIVMNTTQPSQLTPQQQAIVFENFEGRKSSVAANAVSQIPGTFSFSHKVENSQLSNNEQTSPKSNMCEVILSNWKSRSDTRQWIKKCIGPQDKKKKVKNNHQWFQSSNTPISNSPQSNNNQPKFDRKPSSNSISTTNVWSDSYIHTTCLIPGQRKMSNKSIAATTTSLTVPVMMQTSQPSISTTQTVCYQSSSAIVTQQQQYPQQQLYSNQQQCEAVSSMAVSHNPWLNMNSTSNVLSDVSDKQFALPSFREFVSTLGL